MTDPITTPQEALEAARTEALTRLDQHQYVVESTSSQEEHVVAMIRLDEAEMIAAAIRALSARIAAPVATVKPLEWVDDPDCRGALIARTSIGTYRIFPLSGFHYAVSGPAGFNADTKRPEAAKAAAQADYEARILSAFTIQPAPDLEAVRAEAVAGAYAAAARAFEGDTNLNRHICCNGHMCGCQGATAGDYVAYQLRAITPADAQAALARLIRDAEIRGQAKAGAIFSTSGAEQAYIDAGNVACPACGGSGHRDDAAAALARRDAETRAALEAEVQVLRAKVARVVAAFDRCDAMLEDANEFTAAAWLDLLNAVSALREIGGQHD